MGPVWAGLVRVRGKSRGETGPVPAFKAGSHPWNCVKSDTRGRIRFHGALFRTIGPKVAKGAVLAQNGVLGGVLARIFRQRGLRRVSGLERGAASPGSAAKTAAGARPDWGCGSAKAGGTAGGGGAREIAPTSEGGTNGGLQLFWREWGPKAREFKIGEILGFFGVFGATGL